MFDSQVTVAFIAAMGGIISTYVAVYIKNNRFKTPNKDRAETIFDGYEALITELRAELTRKVALIDQLEAQLDKMHTLVNQLRADLGNSQINADKLSHELDTMKISYRKNKPKEAV